MITINGTLHSFCKDCPYIELTVIAETTDGKIYDCENSGLCSRLWHILQTERDKRL